MDESSVRAIAIETGVSVNALDEGAYASSMEGVEEEHRNNNRRFSEEAKPASHDQNYAESESVSLPGSDGAHQLTSSSDLAAFFSPDWQGDADGALFPNTINNRCSRVLSPLCGQCQNMLKNWSKMRSNPRFKLAHHKDTFEFEKAAMDECSLCYQLWRDEAAPNKLQLARDVDDPIETNVSLEILAYPSKWYIPFGQSFTCTLAFMFPVQSDYEDEADYADAYLREIISFEATMIPTKITGKHCGHVSLDEKLTIAD
jgi:hypothetical protein